MSNTDNLTIERQVEDFFNEVLKKAFPGIVIEYPFNCDGYCKIDEQKHLYLLTEYKKDSDFTSKYEQSKVLAQVIAYLKKFENSDYARPAVVLIASKNSCFVVHTNSLLKYLSFENIDWDITPCNFSKNTNLLLALNEDKNLNPYVFKNNKNFNEVIDQIKNLITGVKRFIRVNEHNINKVFNTFTPIIREKLTTNELCALFYNVITDSDTIFIHPNNQNNLIWNNREIKINVRNYNSFKNYFETNLSVQEKRRLSAVIDRLIEDKTRLKQGAFFTPTEFADYSHKMLNKSFTENWKDDYVIWDCCCGTKNLTRDYRFNELYCSTLEESELDISKKYNKEATTFQFDFLNDNISKVPTELLNALKSNKKIIFFINPPYGTGGGSIANAPIKAQAETVKNNINIQMHEDRLGSSATNLYVQFLYRIVKIKQQFNLTNVNIAVFCPPGFIQSSKFKVFRNFFFNNFKYNSGMIFNSIHFDNVENGAILFSIWNTGKQINYNEFIVDKVEKVDGDVTKIDNKLLYNCDNEIKAADWIKQGVNTSDKFEYITGSSGLVIRDDFKGKTVKNQIGDFGFLSNDIYHSTQGQCIMTIIAGNSRFPIVETNFDKVITYFTARLSCKKDWTNQFDNFIAPNTTNPKWQEFVNDSLVYSLFNSKSQQTSLRQVKYHDKFWNVTNQWTWYSQSKVLELADKYGLDETFNDSKTLNESFVYKRLISTNLSLEAQAVIDKANELLEQTMKFRKTFNNEYPEAQVLNADIGWYQVKLMLKTYMVDELKNFRSLYKKLEIKLQPEIYELGFLKQ